MKHYNSFASASFTALPFFYLQQSIYHPVGVFPCKRLSRDIFMPELRNNVWYIFLSGGKNKEEKRQGGVMET